MSVLLSLAAAPLVLAPVQAQTGAGCTGSLGVQPELGLRSGVKEGLPVLADVVGKPATNGLILAGLNTSSYLGLALPLDLGGIDAGLGGCSLYQVPAVQIPFEFDADGRALVSLPGWQAGVQVHFQVMDLELDFVAGTVRSSFSAGYSEVSEVPVGPLFAGAKYPLGLNPEDVAIGDIDGDGDADMVGADPYSGLFGVLLGDGSGGYISGLPQGVAWAAGASQVELEDLDGDGVLDAVHLARPSVGAGQVRVTPGIGDGTFGVAMASSMPGEGAGMRLEDLDGDGWLDAGVALKGGGAWVAAGRGDGTFEAGVVLGAGGVSRGIAFGDVDGDGATDLVVGRPGASGSVETWLGDGALGFVAGPVVSGVGSIDALVLGDFDEDGVDDLALSSAPGYFDGRLEVRLGSGAGAFGAPLVFELENWAPEIEALDLNLDGHLDLVLSSGVTFAYGRGDGSFEEPVSYLALSSDGFGVGDLDADGRPDVVVTAVNRAMVLMNLGGGGLGGIRELEDWADIDAMEFSDMNGDGREDLVMTSPGPGVIVRLQLPLGGLGPELVTPAGVEPRALATADFDGDGNGDAAVANPSTVVCLLGDGAGGLQGASTSATDEQPWDIASGDMDGDGVADLVAMQIGQFQVLTGFGDGTFSIGAPVSVGSLQPNAFVEPVLELADFDLDGMLDVAASTPGKTGVQVLRSLGAAGFAAAVAVPVEGAKAANQLSVGDLNQDGILDLAAGVKNSGDGLVRIVFGVGDGSFGAAQLIDAGSQGSSGLPGVEILDLNHDGLMDLGVAGRFVRGLGGGAFAWASPEPLYAMNPRFLRFAYGDVDGDGVQDVIGYGDIGFNNYHYVVLENQLLK